MARALAATVIALVGCGPVADAELLRIERIEPAWIEPGTAATVWGDGFPPGSDGTVGLTGTVHRPGQAPSEIDVTLPASAVSTEALTFIVSEDVVRAAGGRGTFRGSVRACFPTPAGGRVSGRLPRAILDFREPAQGRVLESELKRVRSAVRFVQSIGLGVRTAEDGRGLVVDSVESGSPAHRRGLAKGDRVLQSAGVHLSHLADLAPRPDRDAVDLQVERPGHPEPLDITLPSEARRNLASSPRWDAATFAGSFLFVLLLLFAPTARLTRRAVRSLADVTARRAATAWLIATPTFDAGWRGRMTHRVWTVLAVLAVTMAFAVFPFAARVLEADIDLGALIVLASGSQIASALFARQNRNGPGFLGPIRNVIVGTVAIGCVIALNGTLSLESVVTSQGGAPWDWNIAKSPVGTLEFVALATVTLGATRRSVGTPMAQLTDRLALFLWCGLAAAVFFGGWRLPMMATDPLGSAPLLRVAGLLVFCLKAWLVALLALVLGHGSAEFRTGWWAIAAAVIGAALTVGVLVWPWPAGVERISGTLLAGAGAAVFATAVLRIFRPAEPARPVFPTL